MFIWVDLRRYLTGKREAKSLSIHQLAAQEKEAYQRREMEIRDRLFSNGVGIGLGTNFSTEELGWFRLSFSVPRAALETGLQRLLKTLQQVEKLD
jgi:bifunctional pyridoxal-dependent enzyme with beta-cystathionase and maltose regulon repressor activities